MGSTNNLKTYQDTEWGKLANSQLQHGKPENCSLNKHSFNSLYVPDVFPGILEYPDSWQSATKNFKISVSFRLNQGLYHWWQIMELLSSLSVYMEHFGKTERREVRGREGRKEGDWMNIKSHWEKTENRKYIYIYIFYTYFIHILNIYIYSVSLENLD